MTLPSETTLALISWLATTNTSQLHSLIRRRRISHSACTSFRALAEALLSPGNIRESLHNLPREELDALKDPGSAKSSTLATLEEAGFISRAGDSVSLLVPPSALHILETLTTARSAPQPSAPAPLRKADIGAAASHGLALVVSLSDLLDAIADSRFPLSNDGSPTATSVKNLQGELGSGYDIEMLWRCASRARLLGIAHGAAALRPRALQWREWPDATRYALLVEAWWAEVPTWLASTIEANHGMAWDASLVSHLSYHYPLVEPEPSLSELVGDAESLGLLHGTTPTPWAETLWRKRDVATSFEKWCPSYAPGVFAHDDYTLLATGPLNPRHRSVLASITARELGGLVPRYRMTSSSLLNALQDGVTPESIPGLLSEVCVNEVPASMLALAEDVARRALDLEVHSRGDSTAMVTRRDTLSEELLSDPGLIVLGLKRTGDCELTCTWPAERVHSTLLAASYPSLLVDGQGAPLSADIPLAEDLSETDDELHLAGVAELVRAAEESAAQGVPAGFHSIIDVATETKTPLEIVVTMPDGTSATVVMEPRALSAGRLRGVELKHAVEKTFPVSHITSLRAWSEVED